MSLERVAAEILEKCKKDAEDIIARGEKESKVVVDEARKRADALMLNRERECSDATARLKQRELSSAELESKKIMLNAEKEMLDSVYNECLKTLSNLPNDRNERLLKRLMEKGALFPKGKIFSNTRDSEFVKKNSKYVFGGTIDCVGGIVVENEDGSKRIDYRFESLLNEVWNKHLKDVAGIVFK